MFSTKHVCSLYIENLQSVVRPLGKSMLQPNTGGLVHFRTLEQVNYALRLQKDNAIHIHDEVPQAILYALNGGDVDKLVEDHDQQEEEPVKTPAVEADAKPDWYLTPEEVEEKNKGELLEWSKDVPNLTISKSKNATQVTEAVHAFMSEQFDEYEAPQAEQKEEDKEEEKTDEKAE